MRELDPKAVSVRRRRRIKQKIYKSYGPSHVWHVCGYDKLKPYGFSIHGCIDRYTSIKVKVFDKGDIESQTLMSGSQMNKCQVAVADQTATMPLTVWHKEIEDIVIGESYNICIVFGRKSITTCPDTVISKVSDIGHCLYQPTGNTSYHAHRYIQGLHATKMWDNSTRRHLLLSVSHVVYENENE
ncbi:hypothetical protein KUTeg_011757 [Tegillarca granosa]|uniref:Uncharacterized protein n=1 Tax=Tegillarca granosa TaxID=220873 RepID=A0ABQ9EXK0_TEGGR|nr:hypothetical protein KUTeg_011757 [Tegillarca granosa]